MIVMRMCGGLGNQLFQYALGRRLSLDRKTALLLDISPFQSPGPGETPRSYRLNHLAVQATPTLDWQQDLIKSAPPGTQIQCQGVMEQSEAFNPNALTCADTAYLVGYWQTERYFTDIADIIRADFALASPMTAERQAVAAQMDSTSISVHVRRADYVSMPNVSAVHGTCSPEWYDQAMRQMAAQIPNPRFFIFSDEPQWARANLPAFDNMFFVDPQPDNREYEDLHLMSKCAHHIIANSSFSWWGAWLNPSQGKKVIAPARWFLKPSDLQDRIPASWDKL